MDGCEPGSILRLPVRRPGATGRADALGGGPGVVIIGSEIDASWQDIARRRTLLPGKLLPILGLAGTAVVWGVAALIGVKLGARGEGLGSRLG